MNLFYNSTYSKIKGVIRFYIVKLRYGSKIKSTGTSLIGKSFQYFIDKGGSITHGNRNVLSDYGYMYSKGELTIGDNFFVNSHSRIICHSRIKIGNNVTLASYISIFDHDHKYELKEDALRIEGYISETIEIGNNVWIGDKATILKGVKIGNNVIIAAGAVINKDISSNVIVGGVPAKILKHIK